MSKSKDITPHNDKGQRHGYWEYYWFSTNLYYKCNFVNGKAYGYCEEYYSNGELWYKTFYII